MAVEYPRRIGGRTYRTREDHQQAGVERARAEGATPACCVRCGAFSDEVRHMFRCEHCEELVCGRDGHRAAGICRECAGR